MSAGLPRDCVGLPVGGGRCNAPTRYEYVEHLVHHGVPVLVRIPACGVHVDQVKGNLERDEPGLTGLRLVDRRSRAARGA